MQFDIKAGFCHALYVLQLLKLFLPTWKFFDHVGLVPVVYFRMGDQEGHLSQWRKVIEVPERQWMNFILNPKGNWISHQHTALHQLLNDNLKFEVDDLEKSNSFQFIKSLVEQKLISSEDKKNFYQFKVAGVSTQNFELQEEDLILSPIYSASELWS